MSADRSRGKIGSSPIWEMRAAVAHPTVPRSIAGHRMEVGLWVPYTTLALAAVGATAAVIGACLPYAKARGEAAAKVSACLPSPKVVLNFNEIGSRRRHAKLGFAPARDGSVCHLTDAQVIFPKGSRSRSKTISQPNGLRPISSSFTRQ